MIWYCIAAVAIAAAGVLLIVNYIRERRYERLKTSQAMSPELWSEIQKERDAAMARREGFRKALSDAQGKDASSAGR